MNQVNEYWYMGSMLARSLTQKNITVEWTATGLYPILVSSITFSVSLATCCFAVISSESTFDDDRISMAVSSSRMFPSEDKTWLVDFVTNSYLLDSMGLLNKNFLGLLIQFTRLKTILLVLNKKYIFFTKPNV